MARERKTDLFLRRVAEALAMRLGPDWHNNGGVHPRLLMPTAWGEIGVMPSMNYRSLPFTQVHLVYGLSHRALSGILRTINESRGYASVPFFDVWQDTVNRPLKPGAIHSSVENYNESAVDHVYDDLIAGEENELVDFLTGHGDLRTLRTSFENSDHAFFDIGSDAVVAIDYALNDWSHLREYVKTQPDGPNQRQITQALQALKVVL